LSGYNIDPNTGSLTTLSGNPFALGLSVPTSVATDSTMTTPGLYITNSGVSMGSISAFTVGSSGAQLTSIAGSPFPAQVGPTAGLFFNGGDGPTFNYYYLETDSSSNTVSVYLVNSTTGALSPMPNGPFATGAGPDSVAGIQIFVSNAQANFDHVYVANSGDGTISIYSMDTQTGVLAPLQSGPVTVGSGLSAVAASQAGNYLLASSSQGIWAFSTDSGGALVTVLNSPFVAGVGPGPLATLFNYVYVVNTVDQTISAFTQDSASGQLTPVGAPVQTGHTPSSIVVIARPNYNPG
jgi:6-phosphogluconolactonase (cycloisomerase 2 family)